MTRWGSQVRLLYRPNKSLSRRGFGRFSDRGFFVGVALTIGALVLPLLGCARPPNADPVDGRALIHILTDIHYLADSLHDDGELFRELVYRGDGKNVELIGSLLEAYSFAAKRERPDVIIVTGDLTLNGERESHLALARYFSSLESLGARVLVLPGNHDIQNPWARGYFGDKAVPAESVSSEEFKSIYGAFGFDEAIASDRESLSYVAEPVRGLRVFMLDSCDYADNEGKGYPEAGGGFRDGTIEWFGANAGRAKRRGAAIVVAMHHSAVDHNPFVSEGYTIYNPEPLLDAFAEAGVGFALTGHVHVQDIGERRGAAGAFRDIATNALSVYPHNYGSLAVSPKDRTMRYRARPVDVEAWARASGNSDERLLGFSAYSERFFRDRSALMVHRMLARGDLSLSPEWEAAIVDMFGTLNARFFAGKARLNAADIASSEIFGEVAEGDYGFLSAYARSIVEDLTPENGDVELGY